MQEIPSSSLLGFSAESAEGR